MDRTFADSFLSTMHQINRMTRRRTAYGSLPRGDFFILSYIDMCSRGIEASEDGSEPFGGVNVTRLAKMLGISSAAVSKHLKIVESKGYIARNIDDKDRRFVYITLTDKGKKLVLQARRDAQDRILTALKTMGEADSVNLLRLLTRLLDIMDIGDAAPAE